MLTAVLIHRSYHAIVLWFSFILHSHILMVWSSTGYKPSSWMTELSMVTAVVPLLTMPLCRALLGNKYVYQVPKSLNTRYCHSNQNGRLCPGFEALWRYLLSDLEWYVRPTNYLPKMTENTLFPDSLTGFVLCFESTIHASTSWTAFAPLRSGYNRPVFFLAMWLNDVANMSIN